MIPRVRDEMHERDEHAERADQAGGIEAGEASGSYRLAHGGPRRAHPLRARLQRVAVGTQPAIAGIVLDQESHSAADDGGKAAEDEIGIRATRDVDEERRKRRHDERADADPADGEAGGKSAAPHEPALHRAHGRNIGAADAQSYAEAIGRIDFRQAVRGAGGGQAHPRQDHADDGQPAGTPAVGERPAHDTEAEVEKPGQREHERNRTARGPEILLQGPDEGAEGIGAAEAHEMMAKAAATTNQP